MSLATSSPPLAGTPPAPKRAKSPPMAFERTSNDALAPRISPPFYSGIDPFLSNSSRTMSPNGSPYGSDPGLQALVHKQAQAMDQLHSAFAMEREVWTMEKAHLYERISNLEKLLNTNSGHRCVTLFDIFQIATDHRLTQM
jgi:hypothetical protein